MAGDGCHARVRRGWSDLPDDILDMIYRGCCFSPYDRAHFAGVCSSWRAVTSGQPKLPALPLLLPLTWDAKRDQEARAYSLEDGRALRVLPRGYPQGRIVGSHDSGWVAAVTGARRLLIVNVFSGARVPLSLKQSIVGCKHHPRAAHRVAGRGQTSVTKIIFSGDPSSSDCVIAAIIRIPIPMRWNISLTRCNIALCKVGCPDGGWTTGGCGANGYKDLTGIAFCNEKLYGFAYGDLYRFDVGMNENGAPSVTSVHCIHIESGILCVSWQHSHKKYVFQLNGKLVVAVEFFQVSYPYQRKTHFFRVFELTDSGCTWAEVTSLGDHALFVGEACCKAVRVPVIGGRSGLERNHIYCFEQRICSHHETECLKILDGRYTVCYAKHEGVDPSQRIMSRGYCYGRKDGNNDCIWILPPHL